MKPKRVLAAGLGLVVCLPPTLLASQDIHVLPMPDVTPGKVQTYDLGYVCSHVIKDRRRVSKSDKAAAFAEYDVPVQDRHLYVIDHLVPLDIGGSNDLANLWPQGATEAKLKDRLERRLGDLVCSNRADLATVQREVADDWWAAYVKYMGHE